MIMVMLLTDKGEPLSQWDADTAELSQWPGWLSWTDTNSDGEMVIHHDKLANDVGEVRIVQ